MPATQLCCWLDLWSYTCAGWSCLDGLEQSLAAAGLCGIEGDIERGGAAFLAIFDDMVELLHGVLLFKAGKVELDLGLRRVRGVFCRHLVKKVHEVLVS